ncbi:MAG: YebC/PmpR family DNA-binding transcriptional regulator [Actinomycetota bacterium]|nr:YebC/PmpR family DNA-binding transcriptional regulator [Actinomycetota bacterium]MDK1016774.1 YebC/PmpR family DNA-binding transcriptional regulator [Actinomycetota bacterium]MDK1027019.1 YebC/PmpR family DNA-binding transcriptional regulator [Actinomycetota bacterium]MDK1038818.1 YebC/PmpR family DNA-binding transcriptional regulator [Actinomycetota bacterium]MDK1097179.1 YebC/PmpR family DNA-binding transcriptional regulator [Actinomycetota bacterium]
MAGHSKWANIKHRKGRQDAKRGKLFAKLIKGIESAARTGGPDLEANPTLVTAVQKAKDNSVPKENIERAVARGAGDVDGVDYIEVFYEGYAPGGVALYVQILTDNRNRAASAVRSTFTKNGGSLGEPGSVAYLFEQKGYLLATGEEDTVMMAALDGGAEDITAEGDQWEVICAPSDLSRVRSKLEDAGVQIDSGDITYLPSTSIPVDVASAPKVLRLVDALEDLDDVQAVFANFDIPDEVLAGLE